MIYDGGFIKIDMADNSEAFLKILDRAVEVALDAVGLQAEGRAKQNLRKEPKRIDTGLLRNSITSAVSGKRTSIKTYHAQFGENRTKSGNRVRATSKNAGKIKVGRYSGTAPEAQPDTKTVWIGTNVEYAIYVHQGTRKMKANPFLKSAIVDHAQEYLAIIKSILEGARSNAGQKGIISGEDYGEGYIRHWEIENEYKKFEIDFRNKGK